MTNVDRGESPSRLKVCAFSCLVHWNYQWRL
ncbi:hypothetical protein Goari_015072, partial [Gossypium aridum]|nr:hypothetical protein [Gossypium aridum]